MKWAKSAFLPREGQRAGQFLEELGKVLRLHEGEHYLPSPVGTLMS